jgi:hypothetical protein
MFGLAWLVAVRKALGYNGREMPCDSDCEACTRSIARTLRNWSKKLR